jgi:hypothetical protein
MTKSHLFNEQFFHCVIYGEYDFQIIDNSMLLWDDESSRKLISCPVRTLKVKTGRYFVYEKKSESDVGAETLSGL